MLEHVIKLDQKIMRDTNEFYSLKAEAGDLIRKGDKSGAMRKLKLKKKKKTYIKQNSGDQLKLMAELECFCNAADKTPRKAHLFAKPQS